MTLEHEMEKRVSELQWMEILQNKKITHNLDLNTILTVYNSDDYRATATDISTVLGLDNYHMISNENVIFAKRICKEYSIIPPRRSNNTRIWWTIPYYGGPAGRGKYFFILRPELKDAIEKLMGQGKLIGTGYNMGKIPEEISETQINVFHEGALKKMVVNAYERNPQARIKCIAFFGAKCQICGFDFSKFYGNRFLGMIQVHHIKPLSEIKSDYKVNPETDLIPVCPNCHAALHSKMPPYTPEELKELLKK